MLLLSGGGGVLAVTTVRGEDIRDTVPALRGLYLLSTPCITTPVKMLAKVLCLPQLFVLAWMSLPMPGSWLLRG